MGILNLIGTEYTKCVITMCLQCFIRSFESLKTVGSPRAVVGLKSAIYFFANV